MLKNVMELRNSYIGLYKIVRQYILSYRFVEFLSAFEAEVYKGFPDSGKLQKYISGMKSELYNCDDEANSIIECLDSLSDEIASYNEIYMKLPKVKEVVDIEDK